MFIKGGLGERRLGFQMCSSDEEILDTNVEWEKLQRFPILTHFLIPRRPLQCMSLEFELQSPGKDEVEDCKCTPKSLTLGRRPPSPISLATLCIFLPYCIFFLLLILLKYLC